MSRSTNRRTFLQESAAIGIGLWAGGGMAAKASTAANERVRFACIGVGGKGDSDSEDAGKHGDVLAICDIDDARLDSAASKKFPSAQRFNDYRKLFDEVGKSIDAVTVSTPDHHHAFASIMAMKMGKACFLPEAADAFGFRSAPHGSRGPRNEGGHADGQSGNGRGFIAPRGPLLSAAVTSALSKKSTSGPIARSGRRVVPDPSPPRAFPRTCIGSCGLAPRRSANMRRDITISNGAAGGISAPAPWETWHVIRSTCPSWRST